MTRNSHWCAPPVHPLLRRVVPGRPAKSLVLQCSLQAAALSYLHDHQVGAQNRCLSGQGPQEHPDQYVHQLL